MIDARDLQTVVEHASTAAQEFLRQPNNSSKKFCDTTEPSDANARIPALARFVYNLTGATIQNLKKLPAPNYASWLFMVSHSHISIYLDQRQMIAWYEQLGMPVDIQQIRSIVHEL